jgi:hypothetical protein
MSKRLTRLRPENLATQLENRKGTELHVVLANGQTLLGRLEEINLTGIHIMDARDHHHQIPISNIYEVIFDFVSP